MPVKYRLKQLTIFLILFSGMSLFFYLFLNGGAFFKNLRYALFLNSPFVSYDLKDGEILKLASAAVLPPGANFQLFIPKTQTQTPVVSPSDSSTKAILSAMEDGVALYPGSVEPGSGSGRSIFLGHSSRASWYRGNYATVFALLPELRAGDRFQLIGKGKKYVYEVYNRQVLPPAEANQLFQSPSPYSEIDLVTCYPIGSASNRNIVQAKLVSTENI